MPFFLNEEFTNSSSRATKASDPESQVPPPVRRQDRPAKPNGLTKQTYSTYIYPPNADAPRKWHVVAYFFVCYEAKICFK